MDFFTCACIFFAIVVGLLKIYLKLTTGICRSNVSLIGKTVIVTGANTGIGYYAAEDFAKRGARVILACRSEIRGKEAEAKIKSATNNQSVEYKNLDLSSLKSVREFVTDFIKSEDRLDILLNNAGAVYLGKELTEDGFLPSIATNYLGPFLLTNLLLDLLKLTGNSRVVNVGSLAAMISTLTDPKDLNKYPDDHRFPEIQLYTRSKACNLLFTMELAERLKGTTVTTYCLHPGVIATEFVRNSPAFFVWGSNLIKFFLKDSWEGAQTSIYCSVEKGIESQSGGNFTDCKFGKPYKSVLIPGFGKKLWDESARLVKASKN